MVGFVDVDVFFRQDLVLMVIVMFGWWWKYSNDWDQDDNFQKLNNWSLSNWLFVEYQYQYQYESYWVFYFRYFGLIVIVLGFKQMVVDILCEIYCDRCKSWGSFFLIILLGLLYGCGVGQYYFINLGIEFDSFEDILVYDVNDLNLVYFLIFNFVIIFFIYFGCNYQFM